MPIELNIRITGNNAIDVWGQLDDLVRPKGYHGPECSGECHCCGTQGQDSNNEPDACAESEPVTEPEAEPEEAPEEPKQEEPKPKKEKKEKPEKAEAPEAPKIKKEDVRAVLVEAKKAGIDIATILQPYGASLGAVPPEKYGALMEDAKQALSDKGDA